MADDNFGGLKITWVDETTSSSSKGSGGGGIGAAKAVAGITALAGVTTQLLGLVMEAVNGILKPVKTVVMGVLKLVAQLLRPIADILILLLQPILMFLKPIIRAFNETMRPFRQAAYQLMRASMQEDDPLKSSALQQLSLTSIFTGLGVGLLAIFAELLKGLLGGILEVFRGVLEFFGVNVDKLKMNVFKFIDDGINAVSKLAMNGITSMANGLGVDLNVSLQNGINKAFSNLKIPEVFGQQQKVVSTSSSKGIIDLRGDKGFESYSARINQQAQQYAGMSAAQVLASMNYNAKMNGGN